MYCGYDRDTLRTTFDPPYRHRRGFDADFSFGGPHASGFNMVLADGSVRPIRFTVSTTIHQRLGSRKDGNVIDMGAL
jgi:prepilin-type processing-associated H-X9-DG protein